MRNRKKRRRKRKERRRVRKKGRKRRRGRRGRCFDDEQFNESKDNTTDGYCHAWSLTRPDPSLSVSFLFTFRVNNYTGNRSKL